MAALSKFAPCSPYASKLFLLASAFNIAAAGGISYLVRNRPEMFGTTAFAKPHLVLIDVAAQAIALFGVGYGMASKDLEQYWPFIFFGGIGKAMVALTVFYYHQKGQTTNFMLSVAGSDLLWAYLFYRALKSHAL